MTQTCALEGCDIEFELTAHNRRYCSEAHRVKAWRMAHPQEPASHEKQCEFCGENFVANRRDQRFHSDRCRVAASRRGQED